jgi:hypothetical protein
MLPLPVKANYPKFSERAKSPLVLTDAPYRRADLCCWRDLARPVAVEHVAARIALQIANARRLVGECSDQINLFAAEG